jgi:hypothetical protein
LVLAVLAVIFVFAIGGRSLSIFAQSANAIQIENQNAGTSSWLLTNAANQHEIEGYASATSVNAGDQISFFVNTIDPRYTLTIYRLGYYGGLGGRQMTQPVTRGGLDQPIPSPDPTYGTVECDWVSPYVFTVPSNWLSGIYLVKLVGSQSGKQRYIVFVVRNDDRASDLIFKSSVTTYQAYNGWGGKSLYAFNSIDEIAAVKVSYNRPYDDSQGAGQLLAWELNMLAFLEKEGYDVVYSTDVDTHESPAQLLLHKGFLSVGHDEYWSYEMRQNVTSARDQGVNLGFFSSDVSDWQIRFEPSLITGDLDRTEVAYKELWPQDPAASSPATYSQVTAKWKQARFTYPGHSEDALVGVSYNEKEPVDGDILIGDTTNWVFTNTGLTIGSVLQGLLGYEVSREGGGQPSNTILLAHSPYIFSDGSTQFGDMTIYQASSGATVFSTGTMQWSWGLSNLSPWGPTSSRVNPGAQQITRNVLAHFINPLATPVALATITATNSPSATPTPAPVQITAPANGVTVSGVTGIAVAKNAAVVWINVYVDGVYFASTPPSLFNWNSTTVANGTHTISANAYAANSAVLGSAAINVTVQNGATPTASASATETATATPTATATGTATATSTQTPTATATASATPTDTATSTSTSTATASATASVSDTPTATQTVTATVSETATATSTASATATNTATSTSTATASASDTPTATATATDTATLTSTATATATATLTATPTETATSTASATDTPTTTSTVTETPTATTSATASATPTDTVIATSAPTITATASSSATTTATASATETPTATTSATPTDTGTATATPTALATATASASDTPTATPTASATLTPTPTGTATDTTTATQTPTATATDTATPTDTPTATATATSTATPSPTATATLTSTLIATASATVTATATPIVVSIIAPLNGASVSGAVPITVTKAANVTWVNVYIDGVYFASTPPSTFSWNSTSVANGSHRISATAYAPTGTVLGTASNIVTVANGSPTPTATSSAAATPTVVASATTTVAATPTATPATVRITTPADGGTVTGTAVAITVQKAANVTWINIYIDGSYFASTPPSTFSWNSTSVPNGSHSITATAYAANSTVLGSAATNVTVAN